MYKNVKTYIKNKTFILCELYFGFFQTFEDSMKTQSRPSVKNAINANCLLIIDDPLLLCNKDSQGVIINI